LMGLGYSGQGLAVRKSRNAFHGVREFTAGYFSCELAGNCRRFLSGHQLLDATVTDTQAPLAGCGWHGRLGWHRSASLLRDHIPVSLTRFWVGRWGKFIMNCCE
jgi:hypothetical protein